MAACATAAAQTPSQDPDQAAADRMLAHIKVLSSDEFEGRGPGTPGEELSVNYLKQEFSGLGLLPGNPDGTYVQKVPLVGIVSTTSASFEVGGKTLTPAVLNDFVASAVAAGKIRADVGQVNALTTQIASPPVPDPNDPTKLDEKMFKGKAMTYYGRWTYKYEEASAKGAAACLIVHETGPAGYPFAVVAGSWGRENFSLETPDGNANRVSVEGWLTLAYAKSFFTAAGFDFDALKAAAVRKDFRPVDLNAKASFSITNKIRSMASRNVIAKLEGSDPSLRDEYIIYSAHWDHLGRNPRLKGDQIFNGAADNASGCAGVLEIARKFSNLPAAERPKRSILFLAVTAEEQGLLGSEFYAQHPLYPLTKTLADINIDGMQLAGPSRDIEVVGYGNSTLDDVAARILKEEGRVLVPETDPEKGHFYRSDHFEFAKAGVPAFYTNAGLDIIGKAADYGRMHRDYYVANDYHKVTDEIKPWWDLRGAADDADMLFRMGLAVAQGDTWPEWKPGCEFKARRDEMMAGAQH